MPVVQRPGQVPREVIRWEGNVGREAEQMGRRRENKRPGVVGGREAWSAGKRRSERKPAREQALRC